MAVFGFAERLVVGHENIVRIITYNFLMTVSVHFVVNDICDVKKQLYNNWRDSSVKVFH